MEGENGLLKLREVMRQPCRDVFDMVAILELNLRGQFAIERAAGDVEPASQYTRTQPYRYEIERRVPQPDLSD